LRAIYGSPSISKELAKVIKDYTTTELNNLSPTPTLTDELSNLSAIVQEELEKVDNQTISNALINLNSKIEKLKAKSLAESLAQMQIVKSELDLGCGVGESKESDEAPSTIDQESGEMHIALQDTSKDASTVALNGENQEAANMDI